MDSKRLRISVCALPRLREASRSSLPFKGERDVGENQPSLQDEVRWYGLASSGLQNLECTTTSDRMPSLLIESYEEPCSVARRCQRLSEEISELDEQLDRLMREDAPGLVAVEGIGTDSAASLLIAAGDNPQRLKDETTFAHLCGSAPIQVSLG
jgi:hypothetical protein